MEDISTPDKWTCIFRFSHHLLNIFNGNKMVGRISTVVLSTVVLSQIEFVEQQTFNLTY